MVMGMKKHGASGWKNGSGKNPKFRLMQKLEAERNVRKPRKSTIKAKSVRELLKDK